MQYIDLSFCFYKVLVFPITCSNLNLPLNLLCWISLFGMHCSYIVVYIVNDMVSVSCFQLTLMDANYVVDEMLGTASYDISKLKVGQTVLVSFLIGKVSFIYSRSTFSLKAYDAWVADVFKRKTDPIIFTFYSTIAYI